MKNENGNHQLRLSIDIRSIKEHEFTAQLSLRYKANPSLGLPSFRSPSMAVPNPRSEVQIKDCFQSGYFQTTAGEMASRLAQNIEIELWHTDRLKSDTLLGRVSLDLTKLLEQPLRTTSQSYARVLDAFLPVDQTNQQGRAVKTIGSLRVIAYLEDLGPVGQLEQRGFKLKEFLEEGEEGQVEPQAEAKMAPENAGLNQLQRKVVWELQTWKKAEEAKARLTLKQKEIEFWTNVSEQQRKSDLEKEKQFKKIQANLTLLQGKLRSKLAELVKRQQKLLTFEQELQTKIVEVSRECLAKDQEIEVIKRRHKEDKTVLIKEKGKLQSELNQARAENAKLKVQAQALKKEDEKSQLNIFKAQMNARNLEIKELTRQLQKANEVKEEYKVYYGKMKEEVISLRQKLRGLQESCHELLRDKKVLENNNSLMQQQLAYQRQLHQQQFQRGPYRQEYEDAEEMGGSDRERLIHHRDQLLRNAGYTVNDPLILQIDKQIRQLA